MSFLRPNDVYLYGPNAVLPARAVDNDALVEWMGASIRSSFIEHRTGIAKRHWVEDNQAVSDLAVEAATRLKESCPGNFQNLSQVVMATISGDYPTPPTAPLVQDRLGLANVGAFDLGAACAGFVSALHVTSALASATGQRQLLIASDIRSKFLDKEDFATCVLFGDGATAGVVGRDLERATFRILGSQLFSDGSVADIISIPAGGSRQPHHGSGDAKNTYLKMKKGAVLFLRAAEGMAESANLFLRHMSLSLGDIAFVVPHQANLHLVREVARLLDLPREKCVETVTIYGNTSGSSVGLGLDHLIQSGKLRARDKVLLIAAGGGGVAACALLETVSDHPSGGPA